MSNTVDNRVVEMQFKNEDFERGIKQTITSLDSLKKALDINTNTLNLSNIQKEADSFNLANIDSALESLSGRFSAMGVIGFSVLQRLTNGAIDLAEKIGQITIGQITSGGKARAQKVADARFKLDGLLKDADKVQSAFDSASKAVDGTAYGLDAAVSTASQLAASNVALGEDMDTALRGVAGLAAMTGSSFEDMGQIFATVAGNGRLMGMQLTQISSRGINVAAELANQLGTTEEEIRKMVSKGEISFKQFASAMSKAFGDQAAKANETLNGALQNVQAALSRIGEIFYSGIIENKEFIKLVNDLREKINAVKKALEPLKEPFANLVSSISKFGSALLGLYDTGGLMAFTERVVKVINKISDVFTKLTEKVSKFKPLNNVDFYVPSNVLNSVKRASSGTRKFLDILSKANTGLKTIFESVKKVFSAFSEAFKDTFSFGNKGKMLTKIVELFNSLSERFKVTDERAEKIKNTFKGLFSIINILISLTYNVSKVLGKMLLPIIENIGDSLITVTGFLGKYLSRFNKYLKSHKVFSRMSNGIISALYKIKEYTIAFMDAIRNNKVFTNFLTTIKDISSAIKEKIIPSAKGVNDTISGIKANAKKVDTSWINKIVNGIASVIKRLTDTLIKYKDKIVNTISTIINTFKSLGKSKKETSVITESTSDAIDEANKDAERAISPISTLFELAEKLFDKVKVYFSSIIDFIIERIKALTPEQIGILSISAALSIFLLSLRGISSAASKFIRSFAAIGTSIKSIFDAIKTNIDEFKKDKKRAYNLAILQTLAAILAILALSLYKLSQVDTGKLLITAGVLVSLIGIMVLLTNEIANFGQKIEDWSQQMIMAEHIKTMGKLLIQVAASLVVLSIALKIISSIDTKNIWEKIGAFTLLLIEMVGVITYLSDEVPDLSKDVGALIAMSAAMLILSLSLSLLSKMDSESVLLSSLAMAVSLLALGEALSLAGEKAEKVKLLPLITMIYSLILITAAIAALAIVEKLGGNVIAAAVSIAIILYVMAKAYTAMQEIAEEGEQKTDWKKTLAIIGALSNSIFILSMAIKNISDIGDYKKLGVSISAVIVLMYLIVELIKRVGDIPSIDKSVTATIGAFTILLAAIALSLNGLLKGNYNWQQMGAATLALVFVLGALALVYFELSKLDGKGVAGKAVSLLVISLALLPIAAALAILANYNWDQLKGGLGAMLTVFIIMSVVLGALTAIGRSGTGLAAMLVVMISMIAIITAFTLSMVVLAKVLKSIVGTIKQLTKIDYKKIDIKVLNQLLGILFKLSLISILASVGVSALAASMLFLSIGISLICSSIAYLIKAATGFIKVLNTFVTTITKTTDFPERVAKGVKVISGSLVYLFKNIGTGLAMGILAFLTTLQASAIIIGNALKRLILTVLDIVFAANNEIVKKLIVSLTEMFIMLEQELPGLFEHFNNVLILLLNELANNAQVYGYFGSLIAVEFASGLLYGLAEAAPDLINSVIALGISLVKALYSAIKEYTPDAKNGLNVLGLKLSRGIQVDLQSTLGMMNDDVWQFFQNNIDEIDSEIAYQQEELETRATQKAYASGENVTKSYYAGQANSAKNTDTTELSKVNNDNVASGLDATGTSMNAANKNIDAYKNQIKTKIGSYTDELKESGAGLITPLLDGSKEEAKKMETVASMSIEGMSEAQISAMQKAGWKLDKETGTMVQQIPKAIKENVESSETNSAFDLLGSVLDPEGDGAMGQIFSKFTGNMGSIADEGGTEFVNGLVGKFSEQASLDSVYQGTFNLGEQAKAGWDASTDTNSPSKEAIKRGGYWIDGLLVALTSNKASQSLYKASYGNAEEIKNSFTTAISNMPGFGDDMVYTPTIRPVLDDSNMDQFNGMLNVLDNPTTFKMAADSQLSINDANQFRLAQQIEGLRADINKMANQDLSKIMDGVQINVNADTNVDGTPLKKMSSQYTIGQINKQEMGYLMATGGRY